jgi:hypothetical protein
MIDCCTSFIHSFFHPCDAHAVGCRTRRTAPASQNAALAGTPPKLVSSGAWPASRSSQGSSSCRPGPGHPGPEGPRTAPSRPHETWACVATSGATSGLPSPRPPPGTVGRPAGPEGTACAAAAAGGGGSGGGGGGGEPAGGGGGDDGGCAGGGEGDGRAAGPAPWCSASGAGAELPGAAAVARAACASEWGAPARAPVPVAQDVSCSTAAADGPMPTKYIMAYR